MKKRGYLNSLDKVLTYCIRSTRRSGAISADGETDIKDQGWCVLAATIRGIEAGWTLGKADLMKTVRKWAIACADTDDVKSAWSTFCLLYALELTGGKEGNFYCGFTTKQQTIFDKFIKQINIRYLREASKNYNAAAGFINELRLRYGYITPKQAGKKPEDDIKVMMDGYIGDGFFNDDDTRGKQTDRRIDGYSAEIIGLLLHYDEIIGGKSKFHARLMKMVKEFTDANIYFVAANGEYARWGRSLRGGSDVKKAFLWEFAEREKLIAKRGVGKTIADRMHTFYKKNGVAPSGLVYRDKAKDKGLWDEYTTSIQALGYAAYGLAMAVRDCDDDIKPAAKIPADTTSYIKTYKKSGFIAVNHKASGLSYVVPFKNKLTKLMFLWHNRITGKDNFNADMTAKFMPLPYFGQDIPLPYVTRQYPYLPTIELENGEQLHPKNIFDNAIKLVGADSKSATIKMKLGYCKGESFTGEHKLTLLAQITYKAGGIDFSFKLPKVPTSAKLLIPVHGGSGKLENGKDKFSVANKWGTFKGVLPKARELQVTAKRTKGEASIYGPSTKPIMLTINGATNNTELKYSIAWKG